MRAYLTTIGEPTAKICQEQLIKMGFEVVVLDENESWFEKYTRFLNLAKENCIRIDADVIPNFRLRAVAEDFNKSGYLMGGMRIFDFYKNDLHAGGPVYYSKQGLDIIRANVATLKDTKPETDASRLWGINRFYFCRMDVVGMHGFFQKKDDAKRGLKHKIDKKQIVDVEIELCNELITKFL